MRAQGRNTSQTMKSPPQQKQPCSVHRIYSVSIDIMFSCGVLRPFLLCTASQVAPFDTLMGVKVCNNYQDSKIVNTFCWKGAIWDAGQLLVINDI